MSDKQYGVWYYSMNFKEEEEAAYLNSSSTALFRPRVKSLHGTAIDFFPITPPPRSDRFDA